MADSSPTYGWTLPDVGVESWITTITSLFQGIDATVGSLDSVPQLPRATLAFSYHATGDGVIFPAEMSSFAVMSAAPYGAFVGSFSVTKSGTLLLCDFQAEAICSGTFSTGSAPNPDYHFRVVVNPGSLAFPDVSTGFFYRPFGVHLDHGWLATGWAVMSLGVADYSIGIDHWTVTSAPFGLHGEHGYCQLIIYES